VNCFPLCRTNGLGLYARTRVRLELREDVNTPPTLWAVDPDGQKAVMIRDLSSGLTDEFLLGRVEMIQWKDLDERGRVGCIIPSNFAQPAFRW
jgi:hypothetical protein